MDGKRTRWWPAAAAAVTVTMLLLAARWSGPDDPLPAAIADQPSALTAERPLHPVQRQPTILQADIAVSPISSGLPSPAEPGNYETSSQPVLAIPDPWPDQGETALPAAYHAAALDYLPIPASHDQQRP